MHFRTSVGSTQLPQAAAVLLWKQFLPALHRVHKGPIGARSEFFFWGGVASRVPWGWRDSYRKKGNFGRVGDKSMFKMYKKAGLGREGDIR